MKSARPFNRILQRGAAVASVANAQHFEIGSEAQSTSELDIGDVDFILSPYV